MVDTHGKQQPRKFTPWRNLTSSLSFVKLSMIMSSPQGQQRLDQIKIDAIDAAIIDLLQQDRRVSAVDIASGLDGVSPRVVRYRIERLLKAGVISITAVLHPKPLGYTVMPDILIEDGGDRDISIQVVAGTVDELSEFVLNQVQEIPGVRPPQTYHLPLALKFPYSWKVPREVYCQTGDEDQK